MMKILSIDQSTTSTSAFLFAAGAAPERLFQRDHRQIYPRPGWVEHDPEELLSHLRAALARGRAAGAEVWGIANQGESCLAWDARTKTPVSPVIVWQDNRTEADCSALAAAGHAPRLRDRAGLRLSPYFSASKLGWCLREFPRARALHAEGRLRLGTTDAFFRDVLTGRFETDVATASRTALMNLRTLDWDHDLCALFGVPPDCLPAITDCNGDLGRAEGLPLCASIVDQQAALFGHGLRRRGESKITVGTGAFALTLTGAIPPTAEGAALPTVAWRLRGHPAQYALEGGVFTAAAALNWVRELGLFDSFDMLDAFDPTDGPAMIDRDLVFVPALSGLGCPHWDSAARGSWLGLTLTTGAPQMVQAVLEGIALRIAELLAEIEGRSPVAEPIGLDGGLTQNRWFCQFLADVTGKSFARSDYAERTALGTALLAAEARGTGLSLPRTETLFRPQRRYPHALRRFGSARALVQRWGEGG
ncbi:FGGY family carbohydrate kinase [Pseudodonghicola flavimaris]|uniref:ATP:glycerol 3-phosphotransferase n=1 Tax=Pseudodonghicola flavimaris TaxID=3050036 RepID=A0ABT7F391_9RHOB|nr:FGGY family carbohydrate kinase [Pseudodonghicola flavimaris]MDK3019083.1 FGGY family carbohydrate kinase [Pseudodonghicola flavimaris]